VNEAESTHHRRRVYSSPSTTLIVKLSSYILLTATLAMGDPLSLSASVIGIATTGFAVALGLYQIADGIGSAGREVRLYADEVGGFSKMLKMVGTQVLPPSDISSDEQSLIMDVMDICDRVLLPLNRLQGTLQPLLVRFRQSSGKLRQFGLRVQ
jgi:hypothetical protein